MDKRKLSKLPIEEATTEMLVMADELKGKQHIVTASLVDENKILLLYFYEIASLKKGKTGAAFRTFLSKDDYITQDLKVSKTKWLTASFYMMDQFDLFDSRWNPEEKKYIRKYKIAIRSEEEKKLMADFYKEYSKEKDEYSPWTEIYRFQDKVKAERLAVKHKKETDPIDLLMETIKEAPKEFYDWVWETGMSFSRYLIYKEVEKDTALCECTHCKKIGKVDRKEMRLRNNEKGTCPFCGSRVTYKARGKMPSQTHDERWFAYVDPTDEGFVFRYFHAHRYIRSDGCMDYLIKKDRIEQYVHEYSRAIYTFYKGMPMVDSYEWTTFKSTGKTRWCHDEGKIACMQCILYPGNLPQAWAHTPMKYSALEVLAGNVPTMSMRYESGIKAYMKYPKLEWLCKMGLNQIAKSVIGYESGVGKLNMSKETIFEVLGLTKVNTRILQAIDGNTYHLRLLQVAQEIGLQFKPEQLKEYYDTFECNTDLLRQANRKVSLHKLVKYISKESEHYPLGESGGCWRYSYNRYQEREDPRIERKKNMAKDWLEYLKWCKALKYDTNNMFIYMPKNFKAVHDRTAAEYQALQDRKSAAEKAKREREAKRRMAETKKAIEEIFSNNEGTDAFSIKGKGLILIVPKSGDEIRNEGAKLHHCVGTYVERVARGETNIFFIRKVEEPETPYYTMEWKDNRIVQCRGRNNCAMTPEVEAFTKVFEKKMLTTINKGKGAEKHGEANCA